MDHFVHSAVIQKHREDLIRELQMDTVRYLSEELIFTKEECDVVKALEEREQIIAYILHIMHEKTGTEQNKFLDYVRENYSWIFSKENETRRNSESLRSVEILDEGAVPRLPTKYVNRTYETMKLIEALNKLRKKQYIVVHGMRGCGKSTLVSNVLRSSSFLLLEIFKANVYWIHVGHNPPSYDLSLMQEIYMKISPPLHYTNTRLPLDIKSAQRALNDHFSKDSYNDCLLVLDDVTSFSTIDAFNLNCKILVITDNRDVMKNCKKMIHNIKISDGFTEQETKQLISKCLHTDVKNLPREAISLHNTCKGYPLTISLVASQLAAHSNNQLSNGSENNWVTYLTKLKTGDLTAAIGRWDRARQEQITCLYKALDMSIESLEPELKNMYYDLALFMHDVNIPIQVLSVLWNIDNKIEVQNAMAEFESKCLVVKSLNKNKECVYSVHDILLDYLQRKYTVSEKEDLHRRLLNNYLKKFKNRFDNFPVDDSYIFFYLGYHLKEANMVKEFPDVFFNFTFLDKKIMNLGTADLLYDYKKYKSLIAPDEEGSKKYDDFLNFIMRIASSKPTSDSDIIQFALCESKNSAVYEAAKCEVIEGKADRLNRQYFEMLTEEDCDEWPQLLHYCQQNHTVGASINDRQLLLVNEDGTIKKFDMQEKRTIKKYEGHREGVTSLKVSKNKQFYLSTSNDGTVKIWRTNGAMSPVVDNYERRTPSPQLKQLEWTDPWTKQRRAAELHACLVGSHSMTIVRAQFADSTQYVVTLADDGKVVVWDMTIESEKNMIAVIVKEIVTNKVFNSCHFCNDDKWLICTTAEGLIYIYEWYAEEVSFNIDFKRDIVNVVPIPNTEHVDPHYVSMVLISKERCTKLKISKLNTGQYDLTDLVCEIPDRLVSVSWNGKYAAIALKDKRICVIDLKSNMEIPNPCNFNGVIKFTSWSEDSKKLMFMYYNGVGDIVKYWNVNHHNDSTRMISSTLDGCWMPSTASPFEHSGEGDVITQNPREVFVSAVSDYHNNIHTYCDLEEYGDPINACSKITHLMVLPDGNVVYALEKGGLYTVDVNTRRTRTIHENAGITTNIKLFAGEQQEYIVQTCRGNDDSVKHYALLRIKDAGIVIEKKVHLDGILTCGIYDFAIDADRNLLYIIRLCDLFRVFNLKTDHFEYVEMLDIMSIKDIEFFEFSSRFTYLATYGEGVLNIRLTKTENDWPKKCVNIPEALICKFSPDEKLLAVVLKNRRVQVYSICENDQNIELALLYNGNPFNFTKENEARSVVWSAIDCDRFVVIFEREIVLFERKMPPNDDVFNLGAVLYVCADKIFIDNAFDKCIAFDSKNSCASPKLFQIPSSHK